MSNFKCQTTSLSSQNSNLKGLPWHTRQLTHLDTILPEWNRSPCLSSATTLNRLFQNIKQKLQMNNMWIKIKHGSTANSKKYCFKEIKGGNHTCIVWRYSAPIGNLQDPHYNPLWVRYFYPFLAGYVVCLPSDVVFAGNTLVGHWTAAREGNVSRWKKNNSGHSFPSW